MTTQAASHARWYVARTVDALVLTGRGPQRPLDHLHWLRHARDTLDAATNLMVDAARAEGASWADVGRALGISRQAARQAGQQRDRLAAARAEDKQWRVPLALAPLRYRWRLRPAGRPRTAGRAA